MKEWLSLDKYPFKILTVITILADSNRTFQGNLKDICKELGIQYNQGSKNRILTALTDLTQENYIHTTVDKEKSNTIIKIKSAWYQLIRETKGNAAWDIVLKTFLIASELPHDTIITYNEIGKLVSLKESTVKTASKQSYSNTPECVFVPLRSALNEHPPDVQCPTKCFLSNRRNFLFDKKEININLSLLSITIDKLEFSSASYKNQYFLIMSSKVSFYLNTNTFQ
ncbi:MAG: hypothetical protein K2J67_04935 [Lachnospiraceae bacterium]|nr:hypothetical protein [Lachnospiraceae bacterium]